MNRPSNSNPPARQVFPVRTYLDTEKNKWKKIPAIPRGSNWLTYITPPEQLAHAQNLGCVIPDGRIVIDLDTYKGATRAAVDAALGAALDWDGALLQTTVSGGEHYCFELPPGAVARQGDSLLGVDGFDTRAAGKGWICTGHGYVGRSMLPMPDALFDEPFPTLPLSVVAVLSGDTPLRDAPDADADADDDDDDDDALSELVAAVAALPLADLTLADLAAHVAKLPAEDLESYSSWLKIGMALHHQTGGDQAGLDIWDAWSQSATTYDQVELRDKWRSFAKRAHVTKPTRFDYVIQRSGGRQAAVPARATSLLDRAGLCDDLDAFTAIQQEVSTMSVLQLPALHRGMIAKALHTSFGKTVGMVLGDIRKALAPSRRTLIAAGAADATPRPEWTEGWVYVMKPCEFANFSFGYSVRKEAFNALHDRLPEVVLAEKPASVYALNDLQIPVVVDTMYWPGASKIFDYNGMQYLNAYQPSGVTPLQGWEIDDAGRAAIDLVLAHVVFAISDPVEQTILLDWLTYVYQNPGKRVCWALLLQGAQGTGKSFFATMMQQLMGSGVTNLDPTAIEGRFTGWAHGSRLIVMEEIRISGTSKYTILDKMKPFVTNPTVQIEEKGRDHRTVPNFSSYLLLTNHKDSIPILEGDRRYCVIYGTIQSEHQLYAALGGKEAAKGYFDALFAALHDHPDAIAGHFAERKISADFSPSGRAPETAGRAEMMALSISPERDTIEEAIGRYACGVINDDIVDVTWLNRLVAADGDIEMPKTRAIASVLLELGYSQIEGRFVFLGHDRHCVWYKKDKTSTSLVKTVVQKFHKGEDDWIPF